ncbi:MAG: hypothetical protein QM372_09195 [Bacillota bacterium]|nr:hypothetical protein [Bacillota bacterium]
MKKLYYLGAAAAFVFGLCLITRGHKMSGIQGLMVMLAGLAVLLIALYFYNRRHV